MLKRTPLSLLAVILMLSTGMAYAERSRDSADQTRQRYESGSSDRLIERYRSPEARAEARTGARVIRAQPLRGNLPTASDYVIAPSARHRALLESNRFERSTRTAAAQPERSTRQTVMAQVEDERRYDASYVSEPLYVEPGFTGTQLVEAAPPRNSVAAESASVVTNPGAYDGRPAIYYRDQVQVVDGRFDARRRGAVHVSHYDRYPATAAYYDAHVYPVTRAYWSPYPVYSRHSYSYCPPVVVHRYPYYSKSRFHHGYRHHYVHRPTYPHRGHYRDRHHHHSRHRSGFHGHIGIHFNF